MTGWCPFSTALTTASFVLHVLRFKYLRYDMPYFNEFGVYQKNQSDLAMQYALWLEKKENKKLQHVLNCGEHIVNTDGHRYSLDIYDRELNEAIEVLGC